MVPGEPISPLMVKRNPAILTLTKIFHFEMAHAIHGYSGSCKNIHGHSYELHVTVSAVINDEVFIPAPGLLIDFKDIKKVVTESVINKFDHHLLLSEAFLKENISFSSAENLVVLEAEPTAENMLICIRNILKKQLPENIRLTHLKLFETKDSYAEWTETVTTKR